ncbi:DUF192 domain-containing protein [Shimia sp. SDUM112013]|uniref:DUF192 domain-containing protein n=1 Tax=Shimia sp. SDUM112013 TaxID=3136160 RepID=UPI0032F0067D
MKMSLRAAVLLGVVFASTQVAADTCRDDAVTLRGDWGQARFSVEVADDRRERAIGLMNRDHMPTSAGMLFVFDRTEPVSFWMENTLIPLDMLFIAENGEVVHIHSNAQPLDRTPIGSGQPVRYVLEINGGLAARMGITEGSALRHPSILQEGAVWPCDG